MIQFDALMEQFGEKGEKTGWTYIQIPAEMAHQLNPNTKTSYRVKGMLDNYSFKGIALMPMGDGSFIMALKAEIRKKIRKEKGAVVSVQIHVDSEEIALSSDLLGCLEDEPAAMLHFKSLPKGHQRYFSNWIESAKTEATKVKRISQAVIALGMGLGFSEMVRMNKQPK